MTVQANTTETVWFAVAGADFDGYNTVYTIRGLYDLADMARSKGDVKTAAWALKRAREMESRFEAAWWFGQEGATQYADSIDPSPVGARIRRSSSGTGSG